MPRERNIWIRARDNDEHILEFMERIQKSIGADHASISSLCRATNMEYAKVPIEGNEIGAAKGGTA